MLCYDRCVPACYAASIQALKCIVYYALFYRVNNSHQGHLKRLYKQIECSMCRVVNDFYITFSREISIESLIRKLHNDSLYLITMPVCLVMPMVYWACRIMLSTVEINS